MKLADIRDYTASVVGSIPVYMDKLPDGLSKVVCVYNSKHTHTYKTSIGGHDLKSYEEKYCTWLVHWNASPTDAETAARELFELLRDTKDATINGKTIKFILPIYEPQDVGCDDAGIYEWVIEAVVVSDKN